MSDNASVNLLLALHSADDSPPIANTINNVSATEKYFLESDRTILSLLLLSIGLCEADGSTMLNPKTLPWKNMNTSMIKPKANDLKAECNQRWHAFICRNCMAKEPSNKY